MLGRGGEAARGRQQWGAVARGTGKGAGEGISCMEAGERPSQVLGIRTWTS